MEQIEVTMLGTGSPRPDLERKGPSQLLTVDGTHVLVDSGEGVTYQLMKAGICPSKINYLFMTHLHSDHLFGYGNFLLGGWGLGRRELTVVGPKGMKHFHDTLLDLFKDDIAYRMSLGRPGNGVLDVKIIEIEQPGTVENCGLDVEITAAEMIHNVQTYAYRFQIGDKSVVFSGDTAPTKEIIKLAENADILVLDASLTSNEIYENATDPELIKIWNELQKEHCTPSQAATIAQEANVEKLILTHFLPGIDEEKTYREASAKFQGKLYVGKDLETVQV
ncbi:MBL fold metallo-hydrolase [Bacillus massiliigorillae]|uniref:MBL fold metallo-hydrolase n=1 Tax=Bacillus massiliigorillae TaxID=1243664 RepID=UPI00039D247C|nr:MBL fold metallo-hydrolase [Bacillus massiliigorillae]